MLPQDPFHQDAELRANVLAQRPVDRDVGAHGPHQLLGDCPQGGIPQHLHSTVVCLQRVIERQFVSREPDGLAAGVRLAHVLRQMNQLLDHLSRLDGAILVAADRLL